MIGYRSGMEYTEETRDRAEWLAEHGVEPAHVPVDSTFVEETNEDGVRVVTFEALALDEFGRADVDRQNLRFRTERRTIEATPFEEWRADRDAAREHAEALAALDPDAAGELKGAALDEALEAAGLPKSGSADDKRARLAEAAASAEPVGFGSWGDEDPEGDAPADAVAAEVVDGTIVATGDAETAGDGPTDA